MAAMRKEDATMTSEEMLNRSDSWTLACDNALLNRLKAFSENLTRNSQELRQECDGLSKDITNLDYRLRNVTNQFLMLSNTQFVENRVEEFKEFSSEVSSSAGSTSSSLGFKSKAEKEAELMSKMKQAIQFGLKACDRKSLEEEKPTTEKSFRRKRPYLIGSPKFFSSKYCGLVDETKRVAPWESFSDSVSIRSEPQNSDIVPPSEMKPTPAPTITFTMPPPSVPVFPVVPENNPDQNDRQNSISDSARYIGKGGVPPSPTISDRSSDFGKPSSSGSVSRENVPRSITDELNKIYGSFAPPPNVDDDSDDDFRPNASAGRIFDAEEDDDDLFKEKELFPSSTAPKNTDFFSRSNPSQLPAPPVFSAVPPPVNSVPQPQSQSHSPFINKSDSDGDGETLVGPAPKPHHIPNMSNSNVAVAEREDITSKKQVGRKEEEPLPEVEAVRPKLPPGAVSMFGGMPPPVFHNDKLVQPKTAKATTAKASATMVQLPPHSNPNSKQSSSSSGPVSVAVESGSKSQSSQRSYRGENNVNPSQRGVGVGAVPVPSAGKRTDSVSQGSLRSSGDSQRPSNSTKAKVTASSLFVDDSSDEDIFKSSSNSKKKSTDLFHAQANNIESIQQKQPQPPSAALLAHNPFDAAPANVKRVASQSHHIPVKKSIFDESDSDEDLFSTRAKPKQSQPAKKENIHSSSASANGGDDFLFSKPAPKKLAVQKTKQKQAQPKSKSASLFGDESDSDTDLFGNKKVKVGVAGRSNQPMPTQAPASVSAKEVKSVPKAKKMDTDTESDSIFSDKALQKNSSGDSVNKQVLNNNNEEAQPRIVKEVVKSSSSGSESLAPKPKSKSKSAPVKKSIFDDTDSDSDDLFSSKSKTSSKTVKVDKKDEKSDNISAGDNAKLATSSTKKQLPSPATADKKVSLFGDDESDSDSDIFREKAKRSTSKVEAKSSDTVDKASAQLKEDESLSKSKVADEKDVPKKNKKDDDDIFSPESSKSAKPVGNKISEKIKAMQSSKPDKTADAAPPPGKQIKSKVSVKNLALNLNINPLALKVGARPPKVGSSPSTPDKEGIGIGDIVPASPSNQSSNSLSNSKSSSSVITGSDDVTTTDDTTTRSASMSPKEDLGIEEILHDKIAQKEEATTIAASSSSSSLKMMGARAKIQQKRRPPSKNFLKSRASIQEEPKEEETSETTESKSKANSEEREQAEEEEAEKQSESQSDTEETSNSISNST